MIARLVIALASGAILFASYQFGLLWWVYLLGVAGILGVIGSLGVWDSDADRSGLGVRGDDS